MLLHVEYLPSGLERFLQRENEAIMTPGLLRPSCDSPFHPLSPFKTCNDTNQSLKLNVTRNTFWARYTPNSNSIFRILTWFLLCIYPSCIRNSFIRSRLLAIAKYRFPLRYGNHNVSRLTYSTVLKTGSAAQMQAEVDAMRFVAAHTTIPVPRVRHHWSEGSKGFTVMDYIPGAEARRVFAGLKPEQQQRIVGTLVGYVEQLRSIPHPSPLKPWIGSASGGALFEVGMAHSGLEEGWGPYADLAAFNDARMARLAQIDSPMGDRLRDYRHAMQDHLPIVFTHAAIHRGNVLLKQSPDGTQVDVVALLDWSSAGWRPIFWEGHRSDWLGRSFKGWLELGSRLYAGYKQDVDLERNLLRIKLGVAP
ncbi:Kinase-like protein [Mycena sanguinolenta]|uniref:Kinase-like protein n=1 Tax=Mycena sanguinolenta TaxID=230812 RepID=A0A8H7DHI4_9AGAR|nr:Kinase-like protein [Mycena sanguinolenta]